MSREAELVTTEHGLVPKGEGWAARRHGAAVERETTEPPEAYARFEPSRLTGYRNCWLP